MRGAGIFWEWEAIVSNRLALVKTRPEPVTFSGATCQFKRFPYRSEECRVADMRPRLPTPTDPAAPASRRIAVVEQAESYVREHLDTRVPVSRLCRVVGLSERGLRNAFRRVRGMSPTQYMRSVRLRDVRRALRASEGRGATVTNVATSYGFYELGRFAAAYREAFGEVPSETLRSTCRQSGR